MIGARCFNQVKCRLGWFVPFPALEGETIFAGETTRSIGLSKDEPALFSPVDMETAESATVNCKDPHAFTFRRVHSPVSLTQKSFVFYLYLLDSSCVSQSTLPVPILQLQTHAVTFRKFQELQHNGGLRNAYLLYCFFL